MIKTKFAASVEKLCNNVRLRIRELALGVVNDAWETERPTMLEAKFTAGVYHSETLRIYERAFAEAMADPSKDVDTVIKTCLEEEDALSYSKNIARETLEKVRDGFYDQ